MSWNHLYKSLLVWAICLAGEQIFCVAEPIRAATVNFSDPNPNGGIGYEWTIIMTDNDTSEFTRHVGAKSWNEPLNPVGLKGWTHTSD
jgi:hypothetical protein